jgi:ribosome-associated protein YbcJ (S4-like RNA binding protein)
MPETKDGLELLVKSKILNEGVTLKQLLEVTKELDSTAGTSGGQFKWCFIVKGKFMYRDDAEAKPADVKK